jgi:hypothetical protein
VITSNGDRVPAKLRHHLTVYASLLGLKAYSIY